LLGRHPSLDFCTKILLQKVEYYRFSFEVFLFLRQEVHKLYYGGGRILPLVCCPRLLQGAPAPCCVVPDSCKVRPPPGVLFLTPARCARPLVCCSRLLQGASAPWCDETFFFPLIDRGGRPSLYISARADAYIRLLPSNNCLFLAV
jgi:hypothetical protein